MTEMTARYGPQTALVARVLLMSTRARPGQLRQLAALPFPDGPARAAVWAACKIQEAREPGFCGGGLYLTAMRATLTAWQAARPTLAPEETRMASADTAAWGVLALATGHLAGAVPEYTSRTRDTLCGGLMKILEPVGEAVRNLTPHEITLIPGHGCPPVTMQPEPVPARVVLDDDQDDGQLAVCGVVVPVVRTSRTGQVTGLPEPVPGVTLIVSRPVAETLPDRSDLVFVHRTVRDGRGRVIGARALARVRDDG